MSLLDTRLQIFRGDAPVDKNEHRGSRWGALRCMQDQTTSPFGIATEDILTKAMHSAGIGLEVPVLNYDGTVTVSNTTIPLNVTGDPNTSALMAITFTNYYFGFLIHPAAHKNNHISMQREFNRMLRKFVYKSLDMQDQAAVALFESNKTQVLDDTLGGRYSLTSNVVVAPLAEQDSVVGDLGVLQAGNDYYGPQIVVGNPSLESLVRNRLMEKGENQERTNPQQVHDNK